MKNSIKLFSVIALSIISVATYAQKKKKVEFATEFDTASYMMGLYIGSSFKDIPASDQISLKLVQKGVADAMEDAPIFTDEEMQAFMSEFMKKQQELATEEAKTEGLKQEKEFLEINKQKEGVVALESGLQYKILKEGTGIKPIPTDKVKVHYTGKLLDGTVFDSSVERGEPVEFGLNQVIKGWTEGVQLMKEGAVYEFYIPHDLAYGERGAGGVIKPFSTLIFEVELLKVIKPEAGE